MKNFDEYVHFVIGAKIARQEIERIWDGVWYIKKYPKWNWVGNTYRIKLPKGWEYVIEDGEIVFREPRGGEWYLQDNVYEPASISDVYFFKKGIKRPIIKKVEEL